MAKLTFKKMAMPAYWSSYLINGDASGLEDGEDKIADAYLEKNHVAEVVDAPGEGYFSWSYDLHGGTARGGELLDYTVRFEDGYVPLFAEEPDEIDDEDEL